MNATEIGAWMLALVPPVGGGVALLKWHVGRLDAAAAKAEQRQIQFQEDLEQHVELRFQAQADRLADMAKALVDQRETVVRLEETLGIYIRYAGKLERLLAREAPNLALPELEIPPLARSKI